MRALLRSLVPSRLRCLPRLLESFRAPCQFSFLMTPPHSSSPQASVAAPMTSKLQSTASMLTVVAEGRCSLMATFQIFQFIIGCVSRSRARSRSRSRSRFPSGPTKSSSPAVSSAYAAYIRGYIQIQTRSSQPLLVQPDPLDPDNRIRLIQGTAHKIMPMRSTLPYPDPCPPDVSPPAGTHACRLLRPT